MHALAVRFLVNLPQLLWVIAMTIVNVSLIYWAFFLSVLSLPAVLVANVSAGRHRWSYLVYSDFIKRRWRWIRLSFSVWIEAVSQPKLSEV